MSALAYAAIAALLIAFGAAGGIKWHAGQDAIKENARIEREAKEQGIRIQRVDTAAVSHEGDKAGIRTEFITITETVERIIREPFYAVGAPACLDPDGVRQLTNAIRPAAPASQPAGAVPRPAAPD